MRRTTGCISGIDTGGGDEPHQSNRAVRHMLGEPSTAARARLKILATRCDVRTFDAQSSCLEQREADRLGLASAQRLGVIGSPGYKA